MRSIKWGLTFLLPALITGCANVDLSPVRSMVSETKSGAVGNCIVSTHKSAVAIENAEEIVGDKTEVSQSTFDDAQAEAQKALEHRRVVEENCYGRTANLEMLFAAHVARFEAFRAEVQWTRGILRGVTFVTGSAELTSQARTVLDVLANKLVREPRQAVVAGYTSNTGSPELNLDLSQRRAESVVNYLVSRGVDAANLKAKGFGMDDPVASNDTPQGREANQRVEIHYQD